VAVALEAGAPEGRPPQKGPPMDLAGVKAMRNLEYAKPDGRPQLLDLFVPEKADSPLPLIVWIHGGAWLGGSKNGTPAMGQLRRGYAVASINYRLSQEAIFPAQIHDCKAAIRWLRAHAKEYNLDPKRIGVWGSSAGGHLVALLGTSGDVKELEGDEGNLDQSSRVQAVCDWFGPTDFCQIAAHALPDSKLDHDAAGSPESKLIGGPIQENKDKVAKANPITYVSKDDPPFLIMHGDKDNLVPHHQSEILAEALRKAGVQVTFETVKGAGHGFGGPDVMKMVEEFFDKHLKAAAK
jgi:acetyl esterase/lipase